MGEALKWDSLEWRNVRNEKFERWLGQEGAECFVLLSTISEGWDDLLDRDKELTNSDISNLFIILMVDLELNKFWQQHKHVLFPILVAGINAWLDANDMEKSGSAKFRMLSFYIRNYAAELAQMIAFCVGGFSHMRAVSLEIREFLNHESYFEWEHRHAPGE